MTISTVDVDSFLAANSKDPVATGQVRENATPFATLTICQENGLTTGVGADAAIPFGAFYVPGTELVAKEVLFRPVKWMYKLIRRGSDGKSIVGETVYFDNFFADAPDTLGTNKLDRVFGKETYSWTDAAKEANKNLGHVYMDIFGIATINGTDVQVRWRTRGGKMARIAEAFTNAGNYNEHKFTLSTVLPKNDPVLKSRGTPSSAGNYVNLLVQTEEGRYPLDEVATYGMELLTFITNYNKDILNQFHKAGKAQSEDNGELDQAIAVA